MESSLQASRASQSIPGKLSLRDPATCPLPKLAIRAMQMLKGNAPESLTRDRSQWTIAIAISVQLACANRRQRKCQPKCFGQGRRSDLQGSRLLHHRGPLSDNGFV